MSPRAAPEVAKGSTRTITGSFCCHVEITRPSSLNTRTNDPENGQKMSTRGRKLLTLEDAELLRPHCESCGTGEALRPGLDCRCHCPQCSKDKPRCSSPRMALRREAQETCENFKTKLAMTRSRNLARHSSFNENVQSSQLRSTTSQARAKEAALRVTGSASEKSAAVKTSTRCSSSGTLFSKDKYSKAESAMNSPERPKDGDGEKSATASPLMLGVQYTIKKENKAMPLPGTKERATLEGAAMAKHSSRLVCKRGQSEALADNLSSPCPRSDNLSTKYRRPHCPMCSQLGCLRNLKMICYCDPCQERRDAGCTSPRMAVFRNSHPRYTCRSTHDKISL